MRFQGWPGGEKEVEQGKRDGREGRGGPTPGGKECLLLNGGWAGSWSESESESQERRGGFRHRCPL